MAGTPGEERRRTILDWIRSEGRGDVTELAARLQVAAETVRRDLQVLEVHGLVRRTHGGAIPDRRSTFRIDPDPSIRSPRAGEAADR